MAACAEVRVDRERGRIKVLGVTEAFECGAVQNPKNLRAQVEGAILQGLGGALFEAIEFKVGRVTNGSFFDYRVPRFSDVPEIETVLLDRPDLESVGGGEMPIIAIAPAIANAVAHATGVRIRSMPIRGEELTEG